MDKENELWKYAAVRPKSHNNSILSFLAPRTGALAKAVWITTLRERCSGTLLLPSPITDITPLPHSTASVTLCTATRASRSATGAANGTGPDGCLPELDMFPLLQVMCLWYMCFCAEVCVFFFFSCSQTVLQMEHSLGVKHFFFPPLSPHVKAVFFLIPCLPVLSTPLSYVCCVCMDRLMANFTGTCTSDNKGLLLYTYKHSHIHINFHA